MADPTTNRRWPGPLRRRWVRRLLLAAAITPIVIALVGFFVLPKVAQRVAEKQLTQLLGRRVTVARVRMNPFALALTVEGFSIFEADGITPFVGFSRLHVNVEASSIYRRGPVVREVRLESPRLRVVRTSATAFNFSDILARLEAGRRPPQPLPAPAANAPPPRFSLNNLRLIDGEIRLEDRSLGSTHTISGLDVGVPFVSTLPVFVDTFVEPGLRVRVDGAPFAVVGRTKPFKDSLETTLEVRVANLDLTRFVPYVPVPLKFDVTSALLNVGLDVSFVRPRSDAPALTVKGRVALDKLEARHRSGAPLLALRQLEVVVRKAEITAGKIDVQKVALAGLDVHVRRLPNGHFDLESLAPPSEPEPAPRAKSSTPPPRFTVGEVSLSEATVHLRDQSVRPAIEVTVDQLALSVRGLSNAPGARAQVSLGLRASPGGTLEHEGTVTLEPLTATGNVSLAGIEPARFAAYYRDQILFDVTSGRIGLGGGYRFEAPARGEPKVLLSDAYCEVVELALHRRGSAPRDDFFRLGSLTVRGVSVDPARRLVTVGQVTSRDGKVRAVRDAAGVVDLTTLVPPSKRALRPAAPAPASGPAWTVNLTKLDLDRWSARFEDRAVEPRAVIDVAPIAIQASAFSTAPGTRGNFDLRLGLNKLGRINVAGSASLQPVAADLRLDLRSLEILPLQPYFADQVTLTVTDGTVSVKGQVKLAIPAAPRNGPAPAPRFDFAGDIDVANLATLDGQEREPLLAWRSLHVGGVELSTVPQKLAIREVALTDLRSRLVMAADSSLNVEKVVPAPKTTAPAPKPSAPVAAVPSTPVTIGQVTLAGGQVTFSDRSIRPHYSAALTDLAGRVSGLSSAAGTQAEVDLRGSIDGSGALSIAGKVNPLAKDLFLAVKVALEDLELTPASPYAGKYVGFAISKGRLGLSLDYQIANSRLEARNRLVLDQFSFGDKVASPDATGLPVRLAVALLKDRHGVIDLDVPIAGSLNDPEFRVGRAILKVLGNLVVKAATAPFSLIASAFGGGDELSRLDFGPGLGALDGNAQGKIRSLARALRERPGLSFEIEGGAERGRDGDGLRRRLFERKLRAQKALELVKGGSAVSSPDDLRIELAEYPRLLAKAYEAENFAKPKGLLGIEKSLPAAEMEKLMLANTAVGEDALRALAQERANAVLTALSRAEPGSRGRLFLVAPRLEKSGTVGSHVELRLRE